MYSNLVLGFKRLKYWLTANNGKGHGVHSPFVYAFIRDLLNDTRTFYAYQQVEELQKQLVHNSPPLHLPGQPVTNQDASGKSHQPANGIAQALKHQKYHQLLFRMGVCFQPSTMLVLGTSFGCNTAYLALANPKAQIFGVESMEESLAYSRNNLTTLGIENCRMMSYPLGGSIEAFFAAFGTLDLVVVDEQNGYAQTILYFEALKPTMKQSSILVFTQIHSSKEMERAWVQIKNDPTVSLSIDLFQMGLVFFRKEQLVKQHFSIRY